MIYAVVYYLTGLFGQLIPFASLYPDVLWIPSGVALAAMMLHGRGVWPGLALGGFFITFQRSYVPGWEMNPLASLGFPLLVGLGGAAQAWLGARLTQRDDDDDDDALLLKSRNIFQLLLMGGPVACLLNASLGTALLMAKGAIAPTAAGFTWFCWWIGDSLGVLLFTPLILLWSTRFGGAWREKRLPISLFLIAALLLTALAFKWEGEQEQDRLHHVRSEQTESITRNIQKQLDELVESLHASQAFFHSTNAVTREEFHSFTGHLLRRHTAIQALSWVPRVAEADRPRLEQEAQSWQKGFGVTERAQDGSLIPAASRRHYHPVYFIEPLQGNEAAVGFDLGSNASRAQTMTKAMSADGPVATEPVSLVQTLEKKTGFLMMIPVFEPRSRRLSPQERTPEQVMGLLSGVIRVSTLIESLSHAIGRIPFRIDDETGDAAIPVYLHPDLTLPHAPSDLDPTPQRSDLTWLPALDVPLRVADRTWILRFAIPPELHSRQVGQMTAWYVLLGGLILSSMLSFSVFGALGRNILVERLVEERTEALRQSRKHLEAAQRLASLGSWEWRVEENQLAWSEETFRIFGRDPNTPQPSYDEFVAAIHPEDRSNVLTSVGKALALPQGEFLVEHRLVRPNGEVAMVMGRGAVEVNAQGQALRMFGFVQDITQRKASEEKLKRSEATLRAILETAVNSIIVIDADKAIRLFNPAAERLFGYAAPEMMGKNVRLLMPPPYREEHDDYVDHYLATGVRKIIGIGREVMGLRRDGTTFPAELFVSEMQVSGTRLFVGVIHDITERKLAEETMLLSRKVFENAGEAILITDPRGLITDVNPAYERITGYTRNEVLGKSPNITKSGRHGAEFYQNMWSRLLSQGSWEGEIWDRRKNGEVFPKWISINAIRNAAGVLSHYVAIFLDITGQKETEHKLERLAFYDALTGLPNRMLFRDRLTHEIAQTHRSSKPMALMFIDLDRFKWVNDTLGHAAGDELLKEVSRRLLGCVRQSDTVARLGGDEFTIILTDVAHPEAASAVAQKLITSVRQPIPLLGQDVHVGASVGIALYPSDAPDMETLIKHADMAMYQAKEAGRNTFRFISLDLHAQAFDRIAMEDDLHKALDREELVLFYQPKMDLADRGVRGAEALVRWRKPEAGMVNPAQFIPLAEETGLILPMGRWILESACQGVAHWFQGSDAPFKLAVNLSSREFQQPDLVERIHEIMEKTGASPERLELEITESMVMGDVEKAIGLMTRLRDMGLSLAMDDFGTGYSSLGYLKRFPLTTLKIDRSFVMDLPGRQGEGAIVEAIISMAHSLNLKVVAEGVETQEQLDYLRQRGCESIQGYLIGKPMPEAEWLRFYREKSSQLMDKKD
ncbi:MAG: EAL domain-containing protein [Magnetococcales bacterium]|nr:EAL domain-containing protein [Magnetococcales bacterium]